MQQRKDHRDFHRVKEILVFRYTAGDFLFHKSLCKGFLPCTRRAHQNHNILFADRSQRAVCPLYGILFIQQFADLLGNKARLHCRAVELLIFRVKDADEMELRVHILPRLIVCSAKIQLLIIAVVHLAHTAGHNVAENEVRGMQHRLAGAEVAAEQHLAGFPVIRLRCGQVLQIFCQKDRGVCQTETINALLHIANHEEILLVSGDSAENAVLHLVGILILIHHNFVVAGRNLPRQIAGFAVFIQQYLNGIVLLIGEIDGIAAQLFLLIRFRELACQADQPQHGRRHTPQILQIVLLTENKRLGQLLQIIFAACQQLLGRLLPKLVFFAAHRTHTAELRLDLPHGFPALIGSYGILTQLLRHLQKAVSICQIDRLASLHCLHAFFQTLRPELRTAHRLLHDQATVVTVCQRGGRIFPAAAHLLQPAQRVRMALDLAVQLQNQRFQCAVIATCAQCLCQQACVLISALQFFIERFQHAGQNALFDQKALGFIQHTEIGG